MKGKGEECTRTGNGRGTPMKPRGMLDEGASANWGGWAEERALKTKASSKAAGAKAKSTLGKRGGGATAVPRPCPWREVCLASNSRRI